jgi:hypothetical protein
MAIFIIILILATAGIAFVSTSENFSNNKTVKYTSYIVYFIIILLILWAVSDDIGLSGFVLFLIGILSAVILLIFGIFRLSTKSKELKYIIGFAFLFFSLFASYHLIQVIMNPIRFKKEQVKRYQATVDELKRIRTAQIVFKNEFGKYSPDISELKNFIIKGSMTVIRKEGEVPDTIYLQQGNVLEKAEKVAMELGLIKRDTIKVSIRDSLFSDYDINKFGIIPFTKGKKFDMDTASIEAGGITVHLFEAKVNNMLLLNGLDKQLILNLNDKAIKNKKYPGLKVGSLLENNNNEGNWEKEFDINE